MIELYKKTVTFKIIRNNGLKSFEFWIYDGCQCDHHAYEFSNECTGFAKSYSQTHLILLQMT